MNKTLVEVSEFHKTFDHPVKEIPGIPSDNRVELRLSLILEELTELAEESGNYQKFADMLKNKVTEIENKTKQENFEEKINLVGALDAFCDIQYVLNGSILEYGLHICFDNNFSEVHRSNMSKACKNIQEAVDTVEHYKQKGVEASYYEKDGLYLVYRTSDNKTLKSVNYSPANLNISIY